MRKRYKPQRRLRPKRSLFQKIAKNRFFWIGLVSLFVAGAAGYAIFFTRWFQIQTVEVRGNQQTDALRIEDIVRTHFPRTIGFFETRHFLFADILKVAQNINKSFPEVEWVKVEKDFPSALRVTVQERQSVAVWCQDALRECFAIDKHGIVFEKKDRGEELIIGDERIRAFLGVRAVEKETLEAMLGFQRQLDASDLFQEVGLRVSSLQIYSAERVHAKISEGWSLYFDPSRSVDWQIAKATTVLGQEISFSERPFLEYIDLRFGDQAYVKYR